MAVRNASLTEPDRPESLEHGESADIVALIQSAQNGDAVRLGELLQVYQNYLSVLASSQIDRRLRPRVSPSDVVQETMLKAHRAFADFRGRSEQELLVWLRQILLNNLATFVEQHLVAAKRDVRREVSMQRLGASLEKSTLQLASLLPANVSTPSVSIQKREDAVVLADRIAALPADYAEVLMLRNIRGHAFGEVAKLMDRSEGAARMLWLRAIEKLREVYRGESSDEQ
ncbi:MAG: sigma-70 family RNA polymerase sigma factor [Planctomycetota bacterium]